MIAQIAAHRSIPVGDLEPIESRNNELASLLKALAEAIERRPLQLRALNVAARHLGDTAERLGGVSRSTLPRFFANLKKEAANGERY